MKRAKEGLQWDVSMIEAECGMDHRTAGKRFKALDLQPNAKGFYTTKQVLAMLHGDYESERLRLTKEQADKIALENQEARRELAPLSEMIDVVSKFVMAAKQRVISNIKLDEAEKTKLLEQLQQCADAAAGVGSGNTRGAE